jgi:hypothetical protein
VLDSADGVAQGMHLFAGNYHVVPIDKGVRKEAVEKLTSQSLHNLVTDFDGREYVQ